MSDLKVHMMHAEVSAALERLSKLFKPGMKISFIARLPGNGEADVLIGDDHDADELIALVRRRFGTSTVSAPSEHIAEKLEAIAQSWDECICEGIGEDREIGAVLREQFAKIVAPCSTVSAPEEVRNAALGDAEDAIDEVIRQAEDASESAESLGAYRCRDAIRALRTTSGKGEAE